MIRTGTCIDHLLPKGLYTKSTMLVLANGELPLKDLYLWAELAGEGLKKDGCIVREPGAVDWPEGDGPLVFFSEIIQALNPTGQLSGYKGRPHRTCIDQAVFLGAPRLLYGTGRDAQEAGLDRAPEVVFEFVLNKGQTVVEVIRNDFHPKTKGSTVPFNLSQIPKAPETMWDFLNEEEDD